MHSAYMLYKTLLLGRKTHCRISLCKSELAKLGLDKRAGAWLVLVRAVTHGDLSTTIAIVNKRQLTTRAQEDAMSFDQFKRRKVLDEYNQEYLAKYASYHGHVHIVKYFCSRGFAITQQAIEIAGSIAVAKFFSSRGYKFCDFTIGLAEVRKKDDLVCYLKNCCPPRS